MSQWRDCNAVAEKLMGLILCDTSYVAILLSPQVGWIVQMFSQFDQYEFKQYCRTLLRNSTSCEFYYFITFQVQIKGCGVQMTWSWFWFSGRGFWVLRSWKWNLRFMNANWVPHLSAKHIWVRIMTIRRLVETFLAHVKAGNGLDTKVLRCRSVHRVQGGARVSNTLFLMEWSSLSSRRVPCMHFYIIESFILGRNPLQDDYPGNKIAALSYVGVASTGDG